jgi:outer membrane cobalamin receptor
MRGGWLHIAALVWLGTVCHAQPARREATDSTNVYHGGEVTVEAESALPLVSRSAQPHAVVTRRQIEAANAIDISDAVAFSPGVFVKQYGGLGGLRTVSLRGTSAQQTVILIDGVRYRGSADGAFDLGNIPASALERVEVVRGGSAALYGANALGGVINLVTRVPGGPSLRLAGRGGVGSYGERLLGLDAGGSGGGSVWDASVQSTATDGSYPFSFNEFGATSTVRRDNADFSNLFGRGSWSHRGEEGERVTVAAQGYRSERGVPGAVVQGSREQLHARLDERDANVSASLSLPAAGWTLSLAGTGRCNRLDYRDPDSWLSGLGGTEDRFDEWELGAAARARRGIGSIGVIDLAMEATHTSLRGDNLDPSAGSRVQRTQWSGAASTSWFLEDGLLGNETTVEGAARLDLFSDIASAVSPSLGIVWRLWETSLRARVHAGASYRAPSFSEQYYLNYGNAALRPERSVSGDVGLTFEATESLVLESSFFLISTRDQIVSVPRSPVSWSAQNIARTLSRGVELSASGTLFDEMLGVRASYTLMRAEDRSGGDADGLLLVYTPQEIFNGIVDLHLGRYGVGASWEYVGSRFTLPTNDPVSALPHYVLLGGSLSGGWDLGEIGLALRLECSNILDAGYQVVRNYPMPGRTLRLNMELRYQR